MSLTSGWKVELGIGDPAAIGDVGVYDTSVYPDVYMSGTWRFGSATVSGWFSTNTAVYAISFNNTDADGVDRRAELLAVPVGSVLSIGGSDMTVLTVLDNVSHIEFRVAQDEIPNMVQNSYYEMRVFTGIDPPRYGSDDLFGYLVDVTSRVEGLTTTRGRERFTSRFRTGTASVSVLNTDGAFTPPSGGGPVGILPLRPGRAVRITNNGADVFTGFVDSFAGYQGYDGKVSTTILCVDQFGQFTRNDLPAVTPEGAGDTVPERMRRLLDRHIDDYRFVMMGTPEASMQATEMAQDLMSELALTADSEGGGVVVGKDGSIVASGRNYFSDIVDAGLVKWSVGGTNPITIQGYTDEWAAIRILNEAHYARAGGTEQIRTNDESISKFGRRTHTRLDLICDDDVYVGELAERLVQYAGVDRLRITGLTFMPEVDSAAADMAVQADFGDLILVTITSITGIEWTAPVQVFGVQHTVSDEVWETVLLTDDTLFTGEFYSFQRDSFDNNAFS